MGEIIKTIFIFCAYWILVPSILIGIFLLSKSIMKNIRSSENKLSAKAGFWAGLILFIIYFIYEIPHFRTPEFIRISTLGISIFGIFIGIILGFVVLFGIKRWIPTRVVGFVVMFLAFSSASALFSYIFIQTFNEFLLSGTLGIAFGALMHVTIWPKSISEIIKKKEKSSE